MLSDKICTVVELASVQFADFPLLFSILLSFDAKFNRIDFFTNIPAPELEKWMVDGVNICNIFKKLDVTVVNILLTRKTPADWFSYWRNQFYLLDILDYFKVNLGSADKFILLDSDCVFTSSADHMMQ